MNVHKNARLTPYRREELVARIEQPASHQRWCSDVFLLPCWSGEVISVAFAIECHDREVPADVASPRALTGGDIRTLMDRALWARFGDAPLTAPHAIQWLSDNGPQYTATATVLYAHELGRVPITTPAYSPQSNKFTMHTISPPNLNTVTPPTKAATPAHRASDGEPVDLGTGLFIYTKTDLAITDLIPLTLQRTYRPEDTVSREFGIGTTHPYSLFLYSENAYQCGMHTLYCDVEAARGLTALKKRAPTSVLADALHFQRTAGRVTSSSQQ